MRFRIGLITGLAIGYYVGAKAGRARYEQMKGWLHQAHESDFVHAATDMAKEVVDLRHDDEESVAERIELFVAPDITAAL